MNQTLTVCASHAPGMNAPGQETVGSVFREGMVHAARLAKDFEPDLVVLFGSDHRRAFREIIPTFCSVLEATGLGDFGSPTGAFDIPMSDVRALSAALVAEGFDLAVGTELVLDHGFCQTAQQVLGGIDTIPVIPIFINCVTPPLPAVQRTIDLGTSIGRYFADQDRRVLYLASGGLSHTPPTLDPDSRLITDEQRAELFGANAERCAAMIDEHWDAVVLQAFEGSREEVLETVTDQFLIDGGSGAHEVRNWLAAWAADSCRPMHTIAYEPIPGWFTGMGVAATHAD